MKNGFKDKIRVIFYVIIALFIGCLVGFCCRFLENGIDFVLDNAFENNENLTCISILIIVVLCVFLKITSIIKNCKENKAYKNKVKNELKLLAIAIPLGIIIAILIKIIFF